MSLSPAQKQALKTHALANQATVTTPSGAQTIASLMAASPLASGNALLIAEWYSALMSPTYWSWRNSVFESEFTRQASVDATNWSWTIYIARTQGERDAWARMFMGGGAGMNPSLPNVRQGLADIFSGAGGLAQRTHLLAIARRPTRQVEKIFALEGSGPGNDGIDNNRGTITNPDAIVFEGTLTQDEISDIHGLA